MQSYLKTYELTFRTLSPVFIGSGSTITKKEYIYDRFANRILIPDMDKMFEELKKHKLLRQYEDYMVRENYDLLRFLRDYQISKTEYTSWCSRVEDMADIDAAARSIKEILTFVKDPYGNPYVPGSSIKGMLRNALMSYLVLEDINLQKKYANKIKTARKDNRSKYLSYEARELDEELLHRTRCEGVRKEDKVNDVMAGFHVSDSEPISPERLCLCQKVDLKVDGSQGKLNILRECLKPGTKISFTITIDTQLFPYKMGEVQKAIRKFWENYKKEFMSCFKNCPKIPEEKYLLLLGGGVGYPSKTVTYSIVHGREGVRQVSEILDATISGKARKEHRHQDDLKKGASPHVLKCTVYEGKLMQMGVCKIQKLKAMEK